MKRYVWLSLFAVAMAYLESAVVVYLREIYYPNGFQFPVILVPLWIAAIELGRELATVLMILGVAVLASRDRLESFLHFSYLFGVWDIFYYLWLKVFLNWPESLLTWDILFLIPLPWLGPVLAPVLVAIGLVAGSITLLRYRSKGIPVEIPMWGWVLEVLAGVVVIVSFIWEFRVVLEERVPTSFPWAIYAAGMTLGLVVFFLVVRRIPRQPMYLAKD
jgi:hypothetical protein